MLRCRYGRYHGDGWCWRMRREGRFWRYAAVFRQIALMYRQAPEPFTITFGEFERIPAEYILFCFNSFCITS